MAELRIDQILDGGGKLVNVLILRKHQTKGTKERHLYLTNKILRKVLEDYIEGQKKQKTCFGMLFRSQVNHRFSPNSIQMLFKKMFRGVGLNDCSSHSGRRYATKMIQNRIDIKSVQVLMRLTTSIYVQVNPYLLADISKNLKY
jgi:integrase/recombinase XerD